MHSWGDNWKYWDELHEAIWWFNKMYFRITKVYPCTKEKWGSLRFENTFGWITDDYQYKVFKHLIRKMVQKFPNVRGEVCLDAGQALDDEYFEGWCNGIAFASNGSYWSSDKRPKGV